MSYNSTIKFKISLFISFIVVIFLIYILFLFDLQVRKSTEYKTRARDVSLRVNTIPAQRGNIFDRNADIPLVVNIDSFAVSIIPAEIDINTIDLITVKLSEILNMDPDIIKGKIPANFKNQYLPVEIKSGVSLTTINVMSSSGS